MMKLEKFYIAWFAPVLYTLQEDVESDGNQLSSGELVCNDIYKSTGITNTASIMRHVKDKICDYDNEESFYSNS